MLDDRYVFQEATDIDDLENFYNGVYSEAFKNEDEKESLENIVKYHIQSLDTKLWKYHIVLAKYKDSIIGGCIFNYFAITNSMVIEFIVVQEELRC